MKLKRKLRSVKLSRKEKCNVVVESTNTWRWKITRTISATFEKCDAVLENHQQIFFTYLHNYFDTLMKPKLYILQCTGRARNFLHLKWVNR